MKRLFFSALTMAFCAGAYSQGSHQSILFQQRPVIKNSGEMAFNSASLKSTINFAADDDYKRSRRYKTARTTRNEGIGLTATAGACLLGGPPLLVAGIRNLRNDNYNNVDPNLNFAHALEMVFGAVITAVGVGLAIPGPIFLAKGTKRMKKARESFNSND